MVSVLENRQDQLKKVIAGWNSLELETKKKSINLVIPLIESASLIAELTANKSLNDELEIFAYNYQQIFGRDISKLESSDFSVEVMKSLNQINKIDSNKTITLEEKRQQVEDLLGGSEAVKEFRRKLIEESDHKYQHAHSRISWNYGKFVKTILESQGKSLEQKSQELYLIEDEKEFFSSLVKLNNEVALADNFDIIKKNHGVDGIEEHTAINQGTLYRAGVDAARQIKEIESFVGEEDLESKASIFFRKMSNLKSIKVDTKSLEKEVKKSKDLDSWKDDYNRSIVGKGLETTVGYEMEFLLLPFGGPEAEEKRQKTEFEKLVKGSADLSSRKKMRDNYGFPSTELANTPNILLFFSEDEIEQEKQQNKLNNSGKDKFCTRIVEFLETRRNEDNSEIIDKAISNVPLLSREEIYFFDLLFLRHEEAQRNKLALDGVFEWDKNLEQNLNNILPPLANNASFYPQTLDMIRAHEVAIGPFAIDNLEAKNSSVDYMRRVAAEHQLRLKDRDVQINIGVQRQEQSLLNIQTDEIEGKKTVFVNANSIEVIKAVQNGLTKAIEENPWIARSGQEFVSVGIDRKKGFDGYLKETPYYKQYDPEIHTQDASAFPVHRDNTGKSGMVRLARINPDLAVLELRLIGNNTHVPNYDESVKQIFNGMDNLPEVVFPYLIDSLKKANLVENPEKVVVNFDGTIDELPKQSINYKIAPDTKVEPFEIMKVKTYPQKEINESISR